MGPAGPLVATVPLRGNEPSATLPKPGGLPSDIVAPGGDRMADRGRFGGVTPYARKHAAPRDRPTDPSNPQRNGALFHYARVRDSAARQSLSCLERGGGARSSPMRVG